MRAMFSCLRQYSVLGIQKRVTETKRTCFFSLIVLISLDSCIFLLKADSWKHLQSGDQAAQEFLNKVDQKKREAGTHPFYSGNSQEVNYKAGDLEGKSKTLARKNQAGEMIHESKNARPQIVIDPQHDPLIAKSKEILENPLDAIGGKGTNVSEIAQGGKNEILTCEELGDDVPYTCKSNLYVQIVEKLGPAQSGSLTLSGPGVYSNNRGLISFTRVKSKHFVGYMAAGQEALKQVVSNHKGIPIGHIVSASGGQSGGWVKVDHKSYTFSSYYINYSYQPIVKVPIDSWITTCDGLEAKADEGVCSYVSKVCSIGKQTRIIQGESITRDCWQETYTYNCSHPSKGLSLGHGPEDDCGPLRARGCIQINSTCKEKVGKVCVVYEQTYQCKGSTLNRHEITGGQTSTLKVPFCMDGNCRDQGWEDNDEMMSSIAQLSLLKEMQGQKWNGTFFTGTGHQCSKYILNFKDCCGSGNGWGKSVGLAGDCKPKEKALSLKRKARLCHYVGTYCDKKDKITGKCIKKKSSFCCFGSKLLKAFHEQGRAQIGMGWGDAENPLCRGFTIDEIQRIDFSKLDLSEVFEDLIKTYQPGKLQGTGKTIGDRLEQIKRGLNPPGLSPTGLLPKTQKQPPQRDPA